MSIWKPNLNIDVLLCNDVEILAERKTMILGAKFLWLAVGPWQKFLHFNLRLQKTHYADFVHNPVGVSQTQFKGAALQLEG